MTAHPLTVNRDVLALIFETVLDATSCTQSSKGLEPLRLVCSQWNTVAQHARLWRYLSVTIFMPLDDIKKALSRSGSAPLVLHFDCRWKNGLPTPTLATCERFCAAIADHLWRVQSLEIWLSNPGQSLAFTAFQRPAPRLRHLALKCLPVLDMRPPRGLQQLLSSADRLETLEMLYFLPNTDFASRCFPSVVEATLTSSVLEWQDLVVLCKACPTLETLTLKSIAFRDDLPDPLPALDVPCLRRLMFHRMPPVDVTFGAALDGFPLEQIMDIEVKPRTYRLSTVHDDNGHFPVVLPLFSRLPRLVSADISAGQNGIEVFGCTQEGASRRDVHRLYPVYMRLKFSYLPKSASLLSISRLRTSFGAFIDLIATDACFYLPTYLPTAFRSQPPVTLPVLQTLVLVWEGKGTYSWSSKLNPHLIRAPQLKEVFMCRPGAESADATFGYCDLAPFREITTTDVLRITLHNITLTSTSCTPDLQFSCARHDRESGSDSSCGCDWEAASGL